MRKFKTSKAGRSGPGKSAAGGRRHEARHEPEGRFGNPRSAAGAHAARGSKEPARRPERGGEHGLWLHGVHAVLAALANPRRKCRRLLATEEALRRERPALEQALTGRPGLQIEQVGRAELDELVGEAATHQGLALLTVPLAQPELDELLRRHAQGPALLLALDQVTDPRNVGAILRSAAAFGAIGLIAPDRHAAPESGALAKAASGGLELVPYLHAGNLAAALESAKKHGFWTVGLAGEAPQALPEAELPDRLVLCLGAEGPGLRRLTRERCDFLVRLPVGGALRDLNVSNAAAVALYELCARRGLARSLEGGADREAP